MALNLKATLALDGSGFAAGVRAVSSQLASLKGLIGSTFSIGAISAISKSTIDWAGKLLDISDELGVSTDWLQEMNYGLVQAGSNLEDLTKLFLKLTEARQRAVNGGEAGAKAEAAFGKFGISPHEIQAADMREIVDKIATAFETGVTQELIPAFKEIGGKGAAHVIAAFVQGIAASRANAQNAGVIIGEDMLDVLDQLGDRMSTLGLQLKSFLAPLIEAPLVLFKRMLDGFGIMGNVAQKFFEEIKRDWTQGGMGALQKAFAAAAAEYDAQAKDEERADLRRKQIRRQRRETPFFEPPPFEDKAVKAHRSDIATDSLISVGNFLGKGPQIINQIAETNRILNGHTVLLRDISRKISPAGTSFPST